MVVHCSFTVSTYARKECLANSTTAPHSVPQPFTLMARNVITPARATIPAMTQYTGLAAITAFTNAMVPPNSLPMPTPSMVAPFRMLCSMACALVANVRIP